MSRSMSKGPFTYADNQGPDQTVHYIHDQGFLCLLIESLSSAEYFGDQKSRSDCVERM